MQIEACRIVKPNCEAEVARPAPRLWGSTSAQYQETRYFAVALQLAVWASRRCSTAWHVANDSFRFFAQLFALIRIEATFIKIVKTIKK